MKNQSNKKKSFNVNMEKEVWHGLKAYALDNEKSMNSVINELVINLIKTRKKK